jgi:hypothetical protein
MVSPKSVSTSLEGRVGVTSTSRMTAFSLSIG